MSHAFRAFLRRALPVVALILPAAQASADDAALYGPEAPAGSAFIRVLNAAGQADLSAQAGSVAIDEIPAWSVSAFEYLPAGTVTVSAGAASTQATLQPNRFYTAVVDGQSVRLLDNEGYDNKLKALVILYNLTDAQDLSLRTVDGSTTIVDDVERNAFGTRQVNAARARLSVFAGDRNVGSTDTVTLSRGKAFSVFAVGSAEAPRLIVAMN
ncbi:MAG: alginate O-acetyltransferase AlgF [Pseudomonadota bacterium]|nr:alginate O-acetyltransferase AlgF [Pseudomonadota bacterium]